MFIQHEYGIFGGKEGENILYFMRYCQKPMLVTLHTVLPSPSPKMKQVTKEIVQLASTLVVLTEESKKIVEDLYPASIGKVFVIPHGIHPTKYSRQKKYKKELELDKHTIASTFGLLSRGKGLEFVIRALPEVIKIHPSLIYLILGETHPVVRRREGEKYRNELLRLVSKLHLKKHVKFYDQYLSLSDLFDFLKATDIYVSTSTNPNQAVSGTLSYALGVGRAVIATEFSQAKEIVTSDIGRLVPIRDSKAISLVLLELLKDHKQLELMSRRAFTKTRPMLWDRIAVEYVNLLKLAVIPEFNLSHLIHMTDDFGIFQFAHLSEPNADFGYTLDDNARALILCSWLFRRQHSKPLAKLIKVYFSYVKQCQQVDGSFMNYLNFPDKKPTDQNIQEDLEDAHARAMWALGEVLNNDKLPSEMRSEARRMFLLALERGVLLSHLRSRACVIKALALAQKKLPNHKDELLLTMKKFADSLIAAYREHSHKSWRWFENSLTYNNALYVESLLIAGECLNNDEYTEVGIDALEFLIQKTFSPKMYRPIGHSKWYVNKQSRSRYDQQPEDPASMIFALACAYKNTHDEVYKNLAKKCFSWFLGNNTLNLSLYDEKSGGCYDGLHPDRINLNQGAESLVSYLMSSYWMKELQT